MSTSDGTTKWGMHRFLPLSNFDTFKNSLYDKFENLNLFPVKISLFRRYPTCLKSDELPSVFRTSYFMNEIWRTENYGGVDGITLANIAKSLNFTAEIVTPDGIDFGYKLTNGTFVGC